MKKLNKKGFTLIELLAVIVILAIIVVVTVPTILNSINDARLSSLHSLSKEIANQYDTLSAQDQIAVGSNKVLGDAVVPNDGSWHCLKEIKNNEKSLFEIFSLSETDIFAGDISIINGSYIYALDEDVTMYFPEGKINKGPSAERYCSAIRLINGRAEVFLVAAEDGKFDTNGNEWTYALSSGTAAYDTVIEEES